LAILSLAVFAGWAAANSGEPVASNVKVERVAYRQFADSIRITNGTIEAIVVPSIGGRLMRFATVGGDNVLWENPTVPISQAGHSGNWGGEKVGPGRKTNGSNAPAKPGRHRPNPTNIPMTATSNPTASA